MNIPTTPRTHRTDRAGRVTLRSVATTLLLACACLAGCVPIPYKPAASVSHESVPGDSAASIAVWSGGSESASIARAIQKSEPRVAIVDARQYLVGVLPDGSGTLAELIAASDQGTAPPLPVDYVLCVGEFSEKKLHQNGALGAVPPLVVGYEKVQRRAVMPASMVDMSNPQEPEALLATTTYTEVIAGLVYGFATLGRSQAALEDALVADVAHRLGTAHPSGVIRLAVLGQQGGAGPAALPSP